MRDSLFFIFALRLKKSGKVVGSIDFKNPKPWIGQIDYALSPLLWNQGLMTEAATALRDWALASFPDLLRLQGICLPENKASAQVLQKIGMELEGVQKKAFFCKGKVVDIASYALTR